MANSLIKKVCHHIKNRTLINVIRRNLYVKKHLKRENLNYEEYLIGLGKVTLGYKMNLKNPRSFNEKLNWYKLNYNNPLMKLVVDKIEVKKYVCEKGLSDIVIPNIKTYNDYSEININELPNEFVLKNTMDSGGVFVCKNKEKITINDILEKINNKYGFIVENGKNWSLEPVYDNKNRIIVEEMIKTFDGHAPYDYKIFCFNGEPKFLFVGSERDIDVKFDFYDLDFNWLDVRQGHDNNSHRPTRPKNFERMLEIARILSKDFPHVRVDLYNIDGKIYFGELTFYHNAGLVPFKPKKWDYLLGEYFDLPEKNV